MLNLPDYAPTLTVRLRLAYQRVPMTEAEPEKRQSNGCASQLVARVLAGTTEGA